MNTKTGIRILDPRKPISREILEAKDAGEGTRRKVIEKPISVIVRGFIPGLSRDNRNKVLLVCNGFDPKGTRPPGWGMVGGRVHAGESPMEAFLKRERGEIRWPLMGDLVYLCMNDIEKRYWIERSLVFLGAVYEDRQIPITEEEAQEVIDSRFFDLREALHMPVVDSRPDAPRQSVAEALAEPRIYISHKDLLLLSLKAYVEMGKAHR